MEVQGKYKFILSFDIAVTDWARPGEKPCIRWLDIIGEDFQSLDVALKDTREGWHRTASKGKHWWTWLALLGPLTGNDPRHPRTSVKNLKLKTKRYEFIQGF